MTHPNPKDKNDAIRWAQTVLVNPERYVIMDTETTGLGNNDVIVQIAIIDFNGNVLVNSLVKPTKRKRMPSEAKAIHGIDMKMLQDAPTLEQLLPQIATAVRNKKIIIYNAEYDARLLQQTAAQDGVRSVLNLNCVCAMKNYSAFMGDWSEYHKDYTYKKLPSGDHTALGDCLATLQIIEEMAKAELADIPKKWWQFWK